MKYLLLIIILPCCVISNGQTKALPHSKTPPVFFIDSVRMTKLPQLDPNKIERIDVIKEYDEQTKTFGKVYITSKNKDFNFITLSQIANQYAPGATPCLFMINNEPVKDSSDVVIDSTYILRCEVTSTKEIKYLQNSSAISIINIKTRTKENVDKDKQVFIRGN
jgi:hypothetical protein